MLHLMSHKCYFRPFWTMSPGLGSHMEYDCAQLSDRRWEGAVGWGSRGPSHNQRALDPQGGTGGWDLQGADWPVKSEGMASVCLYLRPLLMKDNTINLKGVEPWFLLNTTETRESTISVKNTFISNSPGTRCGLGIRFGITFRIQQRFIV